MNKSIKLTAAILSFVAATAQISPVFFGSKIDIWTAIYALLMVGMGVMLLIKKVERFSVFALAAYALLALVYQLIRTRLSLQITIIVLGAVFLVLACFIKPVRKVFVIIGSVLTAAFAVWTTVNFIRIMSVAFEGLPIFRYGAWKLSIRYMLNILRALAWGGASVFYGIGLLGMKDAVKQPAQPNYAYAGYIYAAPQNNYAASQNGYAAPAQPLPTQPVRPVQPVQPVAPVRPAAPAAGLSDDSAEMIMRYKKLFDAGILTQEEFEAKKKQLLGL